MGEGEMVCPSSSFSDNQKEGVVDRIDAKEEEKDESKPVRDDSETEEKKSELPKESENEAKLDLNSTKDEEEGDDKRSSNILHRLSSLFDNNKEEIVTQIDANEKEKDCSKPEEGEESKIEAIKEKNDAVEEKE